MRNIEVFRYQLRLDNLFKQIDALAPDPEMQSHWARYLCILTAGYLEVSVREILSDYTSKVANRNVGNLVRRYLEGFHNPNMERILQVVGRFDKDWGDSLKSDTEGQLKEAVDSIMANRHNIAHGKQSGISFVQIKEYYEQAKKVAELIENMCK
ncbi:MAG: MAE_28990/MAE_18760 family HEPN-like nuclease [bacterium]